MTFPPAKCFRTVRTAWPAQFGRRCFTLGAIAAACATSWVSQHAIASELLPPVTQIHSARPRLLLRPEPSRSAVSLGELRGYPRSESSAAMLAQLRADKSASAQAMVWLLTGDTNAAERAVSTMQAYRFPGEVDTFHVYFTLTQFAFAYDWLHGYEGFGPDKRAGVRAGVLPLVERGLQFSDDHLFHNYIWMSASGVALWAMATAGEDESSNRLFERIRQRFNTRLFPAWKYLDGLPSEPMGYWALYVFSPGVLTLLAAQSAFDIDLVKTIREFDGDWLNRHFENVIHSTLPDQRYIPWGDLQSGPNGGVTRDMAGIIDALTWATKSPTGAYFSSWIAAKSGLRRFRADTAIHFFLYSSRLQTSPSLPALSFLAGNTNAAHFIARSGWNDDDVTIAFRVTDHFGDHHHYDQGSFTIYKNGLLVVDPPVYSKIRGPQQPTGVHNTLLLGGSGQRPVRGQWFKTLDAFRNNLVAGHHLETGDMPFWREAGSWAAAAGQFAQAYPTGLVQSCVRQILFVRPGTVVVVDQVLATANQRLPKVQWLLQLPREPVIHGGTVEGSNGRSLLHCQPLLRGWTAPDVQPTSVNTHRVSLEYDAEGESLIMAHWIEVGDATSRRHPKPEAKVSTSAVEVTVGDRSYSFARQRPFAVTALDLK